jgi:hypothetical protein
MNRLLLAFLGVVLMLEPACEQSNPVQPSSRTSLVGPNTLVGAVRKAGTQKRLAGVAVETVARSATTDELGEFRFENLPFGVWVSFNRDGYERRTVFVNNFGLSLLVTLQPIIRIRAGEILDATVYADDGPYFGLSDSGRSQCAVCKLIRIDVPPGAGLDLTLTWMAYEFALGLWANRQHYHEAHEIKVGQDHSDGELVVLVGAFEDEHGVMTDVPFRLATALR